MAIYSITINDSDVSVFSAFCAQKGTKQVDSGEKDLEGKPIMVSAPWTVTDYLQNTADGHVGYAKQLAAQADEAAKAAKIAQAEVWEPTMTKYEKLDSEKKKQVDDILATVTAVAEEPVVEK